MYDKMWESKHFPDFAIQNNRVTNKYQLVKKNGFLTYLGQMHFLSKDCQIFFSVISLEFLFIEYLEKDPKTTRTYLLPEKQIL